MRQLVDIRKVVGMAGGPSLFTKTIWFIFTLAFVFCLGATAANPAPIGRESLLLLFVLGGLSVVILLVSFMLRVDLLTVCKYLPDYRQCNETINEVIIGLVEKELRDLAEQVTALQRTRSLNANILAEKIRDEKLKPLFDSAKVVGLLSVDLAERGYEALFRPAT